jgi:hypothetical protein
MCVKRNILLILRNISRMAHTSMNEHIIIELTHVTHAPTSTPVSIGECKSVNHAELITKLEAILQNKSSDMSNKENKCLNMFDIIINIIHVLDALSSLGMGIWAAVVLANTSRELVSEQIYAYVMTSCIIYFIFVIAKTVSNKTANKFAWSIGTSMLVWNCVILFSQIGIENYMLNNYYYYVFVQFVFSMVMTGIALMACCFTCGACTIALTKNDNN